MRNQFNLLTFEDLNTILCFFNNNRRWWLQEGKLSSYDSSILLFGLEDEVFTIYANGEVIFRSSANGVKDLKFELPVSDEDLAYL